MESTTQKAFSMLGKIISVSFATINNGEPDARIANVMMTDEKGLYFLAARGKPFYHQLQKSKKVAICGMTNNSVSVRVNGDIRQCEGRSTIDRIFEKNPKMSNLYPGKKRSILEAFCMYRGKGEIFDLSTHKPRRERYCFGGEIVQPSGYKIKNNCTLCGICIHHCPTDSITLTEIPIIDKKRCLECGSCLEVCPENAISAATGM